MTRFALAAFLMLLPMTAAADGERLHVVSLDYCADQFVMALADRSQILAVSADADKPFSYLSKKAEGLRQVRAITEDVVALQPDVVVRSWGGDARAMRVFARMGIKTVQIGYASDIAGAAAVTRQVADALGVPERGAALVGQMPEAGTQTGKRALYVTPGGLTAGTGTMVDSLISAAGLTNFAEGNGWLALPLEALVGQTPDIALTAFFDFGTDTTDHWSVAKHPVVKRLLAQAETYELNENRLTCPAWFVADEAHDLAVWLERQP